MEAVDPYIPMDRRQALARGNALPNRSQGAVLFADISGFSLFAYTLAQELGPQPGAEELTRHLNRVYGAVIAEVHHYGGSVISFSGDAMTCWFAQASTVVANGRSAIACALRMQQVMAEIEAVPTPQRHAMALAIKVAVAVGTARRFLVGQPGLHKIDLLAGGLLDRVAAIEHQLHPGEVAVDATLIAQLDGQAIVQAWRTYTHNARCAVVSGLTHPVPPTPWPVLSALPADLTRDWLLPPVYQRLQQDQGGFLAELRPSVAVFHKFSGIEYDDEAAGDKLDAYIRWVQSTLAHYEGFLIDITMGDKGSHLYIAFGAPIAHEDDATRAVAAALALHHLPPVCHFITHLHTGISQGQMYAGAYGGSQRRTYGVLGNEVNIAAQLMQHAQPGQILVTKRVAQAAGGYTFQPLESIPLKGSTQPLPVFAATGQQVASTRAQPKRAHTPLVGRATEHTTLLGLIRAVANGQSNVVLIEGETGIGKSRLVQAAIQQAHDLHVTVLVGAGDAIDQSTPYYAWRPIVPRLFGLDALQDSPGRQRQQVLARLRTDAPELLELAPLLNAVLRLDFPDNALTQQMHGEVRSANLQTLLLALLRRVSAAEPLCIVLEDTHWLDSASWALTRRIWQETHPLLLVIVTRPLTEPLPAEYRAWRDSASVQHLRLDTMLPEDIERLICYRLEVSSLPPLLSRLLHEKAEGHPFFSEELVDALRDAGLIQIADGTCQFTSAGAVDILNFPNTIQGVITSRIDRLPPPHILTLKVASVIGRVFACQAVQAVYPMNTDRTHVGEYLHTLADLDITPLETVVPELTYGFKHIITQEVVYHLMASPQRQQLHRATAAWYEQSHSADIAAYYPTLAYHWKHANVAEKALAYCAQAGEQALRHHANQEAVRFFRDALHLVGDPHPAVRIPLRQQARWHRQLGTAYYELGNLAASRAHVEQALGLQDHRLPASLSTTLLSLLGHIGRQGVHRLWPRVRAAVPAAASAHRLEAARAYALLSEILYFTAETLLGVTCVLASLNLAEKAGPSPELARAYANTCIAASLLPCHRLARLYSRLAQQTAHQSGQIAAQAHVGNYTAVYAVGVGHWAQAEALLEAAAAAAAQIGDQRQWITSQAILAVMRHHQSEFTQAAALNSKVYDAAVRSDNLVQQGWGLYSQAENYVRLGRCTEALALLEKALTVAAGDTKRTAQIRIYGGVASAYWRDGQPRLALQMADRAAALIASVGPTVYSGLEAYAGVAEVYLGLWEHALTSGVTVPSEPSADQLRRQAYRACQVLRRYARYFPIGRPRARLWQGLWYWLAGRSATAHRWWQKSLTVAGQLHMPYEQGLAYYEIGRHLPRSHPQQQEALRQALAIFARVGAVSDLTRTQEVLAGRPVK